MRGLVTQPNDFLGKRRAAFAAFCPHLTQRRIDAQRAALFGNEVQLCLRIRGESVDSHHSRQSVDLGDVFHMAQQIGQAAFQRSEILTAQILLGSAAVVLQGADGGHDDAGICPQAGHAAFDVQKFLCPQIGAETGFRHGVITQGHGHARRHNGVAAVGNVGEGAAVDQGGRALQRLGKIRLERVLQQRRHSTGCLQIMGGDRCAVIGIAHNNAAQARLQIGQGGGKAQDRHDLTGHRDVIAVMAGNAVCFAAQTDGNAAQGAVIHIHGTPPGNALRVDAEGIALMNVVIDHGG